MHINSYQPILLNPNNRDDYFNPRYIDVHDRTRGHGGLDNNLPYHLVDELTHQLKFYNFGKKLIHIAHRDGGVSTLRPTDPQDLEGKKAYLSQLQMGYDGKFKRRKRHPTHRADEDRYSHHTAIPKIKEGLYVAVMKSVSTTTDKALNQQSTIAANDGHGKHIHADDYYKLVTETNQEKGIYRPYINHPEESMRDITDVSYSGPTYFAGEEENYQVKEKLVLRNHTEDRTLERYHEMVLFEYFIPYEDIKTSPDGYLYIESLDIVVATAISPRDLVHPFSSRGKQNYVRNQTLADVKETVRNGVAGIIIVNVDNSPQKFVKSYFLNLGGSIIEARPITDHSVEPGVYVYMHNHKKDVDGEATTQEIFIPHDRALSHGVEDVPTLYRDYMQAKTLGDLMHQMQQQEKERELERQKELKEMELENKRKQAEFEAEMKAKNAEAEAKYREKLANLELEVKRRQAEYDNAKAELERQKQETKNYYDERSHQRKDASENMKFFLGFGGVMVGILGALILK